MPRSSGSSDLKYNQKPDIKNNKIPPPAPAQTHTPQETKLKESGGFMSNVFQGFSFGVGSSIGHRIVGGLFGNGLSGSNGTNESNNSTDYTNKNFKPVQACKLLHEEFIDCMNKLNPKYNCYDVLKILDDCEDRYK